ncbi:MAG: L-threonylcarbamoyladenylate synthase [Candidatus Saccharimonadales bacterium]
MNDEVVQTLRSGGMTVLRTDTLYGVVARADDQHAVERVYALKQRTPTKSPIVLIGSLDQLFDSYDPTTIDRLNALWPAKVSIILPAVTAPQWLQRGNGSVAYRMPADDSLRALLQLTGPLIAPSANPEGQPPAMTIDQARHYFGDDVDAYIDGGIVTDDTPSKLYRLTASGDMERLR